MLRSSVFLLPVLVSLCLANADAAEPRQVSGIYPHLAMFNDEGECGTGAVVPWADRLWVITYAPHRPQGSTDKLYEITPDLVQLVRPESFGGTPAGRFLHRESKQLFLGPYAIGADRTVRVIPYQRMFGRHTGIARHLTEPADKVVYATMEEGIYEVDVRTLAVKELWADEQRKEGRHAGLPGYHGKGFYSTQGRYVYANNGEHGSAALTNPAVASGCLAEWDGKADRWTVVRRNQFTEVTGPGGLEGNPPGESRVWSVGWDHRSLLLMLLDGGVWRAYRLPKASHAYDGAHGWNTEWPRIRDIGEDSLLMTMHGSFWRFPKTLSAARSGGLAPRSTYLKVVGDFCRWGHRVVLGCDDAAKSEFINADSIKGRVAGPGKSQSNLWFIEPSRLDACGPPLGRGAVWLEDDVPAGVPSEPYLFQGFAHRSLHLKHDGPEPVRFTIEVDRQGDGVWTRWREVDVPARGSAWVAFAAGDTGAWVRLTPGRAASRVTAFFQYRAADTRSPAAAPALAAGWPGPGDRDIHGGLLHARGADFRTLRFLARGAGGEMGCYDLDGGLRLRRTNDPAGVAWTSRAVAMPAPALRVEGGAVLHVDARGRRWRLPRGDAAFDQDGPLGPDRLCREVCTERNLLNVHGTFYELPADNAGGFIKLRPVATHNRRIHDLASYRGLLVVSGLANDAKGERVLWSEDGRCALWLGTVDDLWALGKPRGSLGVWQETAVAAGVPSDACLATGYDRKRLVVSQRGDAAVVFRVEADFTGTGVWSEVTRLTVAAGGRVEHEFPEAFGAYWLRLVAEQATTATATLHYD